jgi:hypothetical protein
MSLATGCAATDAEGRPPSASIPVSASGRRRGTPAFGEHPRFGQRAAALVSVSVLVLAAATFAPGRAQGLEWRLAQPPPPATAPQSGEPCTGEAGGCQQLPIGLGRVGDIEFWAPNRGLLTTAGNGLTVPPGIWEYTGERWHELAEVCGATDGRIAWAGPEEFWTVADGRPGQATNAQGELPPLEDDTLCRFAANPTSGRLEVAASYASLAFTASSYQPLDAAACLGPADCWFAGAPLPPPQPGAFQLHWNGGALEAEPNTTAYSIGSLSVFAGGLYESVGLATEEPQGPLEEAIEILHPYVLEEVSATGAGNLFTGLRPFAAAQEAYLPEYASGSYPQSLGALQLSAAEGSLWAAAGPAHVQPSGAKSPGALTVLLDAGGVWSQVLGPPSPVTLHTDPANLEEDVVSSIAAEPGTQSAWLAVDTQADFSKPNPTELADVVHVQADGALTEEQLPTAAEQAAGVAPKGAASRIVCPAQGDCWLVTTQGWLFHLSEEGDETLPPDTTPAFNGPLVTYRPPDEGLPPAQVSVAAESATEEAEDTPPPATLPSVPAGGARRTVALLSDLRSRVVRGSTLQVSFRLAVTARVRLLASRHGQVLASTPTRTLRAGRRQLVLRLNPRRWPTRLDLQTHALAPLPTVPGTSGGGRGTVATSSLRPNASTLLQGSELDWSGKQF